MSTFSNCGSCKKTNCLYSDRGTSKQVTYLTEIQQGYVKVKLFNLSLGGKRFMKDVLPNYEIFLAPPLPQLILYKLKQTHIIICGNVKKPTLIVGE